MGDALDRRDLPGFSLARLRPTVPEHDVHRHAHADAHLVLLLAGRYVSEAEGMPAVCDEPALVLNPPGTEHHDRFRSRDGLFLTLTVPAARFESLVDAPTRAARPRRLAPPALGRACAWLRELAQWDATSPLAIEAGLGELLATAPASRTARLQRALARLEEAPAQTPTLDELAALACMHPVAFARAFRRQLGLSPSDYLRRRRVQQSLRWIVAGEPLAQAADALGFTDAPHLHRSFVREFGMTPGRFRQLALARREVARIQARPRPR